MTGEVASPISYSIDRSLGVILEVWRGRVTAKDLQAYWQAYLADPEVMALRKTLVDLRDAEILFTGEELRSLVASVAIPMIGGRDWKSALLVAKPVQFGVSRQYHVYADSYSQDSIFYDREEALQWLCSPSHAHDH